jgi:nucleoside-diphosphate-sugar epimerase
MRSRSSVLITGATGFVGCHLAAALLELGREVHLIVRPDSKLERLADLPGSAVIHEHDGTMPGMARIMERSTPRTVFHLASLFLAEHRPDDLEPLIGSNILFGTQLLESMVGGQAPFLVNTGTSWQHYEQADYRAVCLYAATKQAFEDILRFYTDAYPLRAVTLKLFDTYGPRDPRNKLFGLLRKAAQSGETLAMSGGEQKLDLVYIDDVVRAFLHAEDLLQSDRLDLAGAYGVSSQTHVTLRDLVALYADLTGCRLHINWGGRPYRKREVMTPWRAENLPGWNAMIDLATGIRRMEGLV